MIVFENISFAYRDQPPVLRDLSLEIADGEKVALLGLNGSGKSTLLKLAAGLLKPTSGKVRISVPREQIGFVFQQPLDQIVTSTVGGDIVFTLENLNWSRERMSEALNLQAQRFTLQEMLARHPATLSAGEQQRTALAGVFAPEPKLLLLDEPTSYLDYHGRKLLHEVVNDDDLTVLAATQFPAEISGFQRVLLLHEGAVKFDGSPEQLAGNTVWQSLQPATDVYLPKVESVQSPSLAAKNVSYSYGNNLRAVDKVDLTLARGTITAIVGDSGSGKTTLGKLLAGLLEQQDGSVEVDPQAKLNQAASYVMQFPELQFFAETVQDEIAFGPHNLGMRGDKLEGRVRSAMKLTKLDFETFAGRSPFTLSGGERRRVALASILALQRPVLILDEPTAGLDWQAAAGLARLLVALRRAGHTLVLLTHDLDLAGRIASQLVLLDQGKIAWTGPKAGEVPSELFEQHFGPLPAPFQQVCELAKSDLSDSEIEDRLLSLPAGANL